MNIPDDAFFTLLEQALCDRGRETLQRTLYLRLRAAILQGTLAGGSRLPGSRAMAQRLEAIAQYRQRRAGAAGDGGVPVA